MEPQKYSINPCPVQLLCSRFLLVLHHLPVAAFTLSLFADLATTTSGQHLPIESTTNETDYAALLAFKAKIYEDPSNAVLTSWNQSSGYHFCNWEGVTCSRRHPQRVKALDLPNHRLSGYLSPHIANLSFLIRLNLSQNYFLGEIPPQLGRLRRLRYLDLFSSSFYGQFPKNLTHCSELRALRLDRNRLHGGLPSELGSLTKLLHLGLGVNNFSGPIPASLANLSSLSYLYLQNNNLEGSLDRFDFLGGLVNLKLLTLGSNQFRNGAFPCFIYNLSSLSVLDVSKLTLHGSLHPDMALALPNLTRLYLFGNLFTGTIPSSLANNTKIETLQLGINNFTGHVPMSFGRLQSLRVFNVELNNLKGDLRFITPLTNCSNLMVLSISGNNFNGVLPNSVANLSTKLQFLSMWGNQIHGCVPRGIENFFHLRMLNLGINFLTGTIVDVHFGKLQNLQHIGLSRNKLTGEIPISIGNLSRLTELYLDENDLKGMIPSSLWKCKNLQYLNLSNNKFSGTVPMQIFNIPTLISVVLSQNHLVGQFVMPLNKLNGIAYLDVSNNKLSGEIPSSLSNYICLEAINMSKNHFQGSIPSLGDLKGLRLLDLSQNNLSRGIPKFLEKLYDLQYLDLSFNNLEGEVPKHGIFENISAFSILGNNKLCGGIAKLGLYTCLDDMNHQKRPHSFKIVILVIVIATLFLFLISTCLLANYCWRKKFVKQRQSTKTFIKDSLPQVSYSELLKATNGFSSSNLIGAGSFSTVYKGIIDHTETFVAVKVLNLQKQKALRSFISECNALKSIQHQNIVKLLTFCSSIDFNGNDFKALVLEFIPNGSLEEWLHASVNKQHQSRSLTLFERITIAIDVVYALDYLHNHCDEPLVHCDLKPSNILLDDDIVAHVSDFGLAKVLSHNVENVSQAHSSSLLKGSIGYISPEYGMGSKVTIYGDIYSYGIMLLEMFSGKRPTDEMFKDSFNIHEFAKVALLEQVVDFIDPQLVLEIDEMAMYDATDIQTKDSLCDCLFSLLKLGVSCSVQSPQERMEVRDIIRELHRIKDLYHSCEKHERKNKKSSSGEGPSQFSDY